MRRFFDAHRDRFGVEPTCRTLHVAPSSYYAAKTRAPSPRRRRDDELKPEVQRMHRENLGVRHGEDLATAHPGTDPARPRPHPSLDAGTEPAVGWSAGNGFGRPFLSPSRRG